MPGIERQTRLARPPWTCSGSTRAGSSPKAAGLPLDKYFRGAEVAVLRSAWENPQALFVGFKAGDNKANHSHLDLGTFVLDALGVRWAMDLGADNYNLPGYFGNQRWNYYRLRAEGHNTLVINPGAAPDQDPDGRDADHPLRVQPERAFAIADLTPAYAKHARRVWRGIALLDRSKVLVQDEIQADKPVELWWFMHTPASVRIESDGRTATLQQAGAQLRRAILSPAGAKFQLMDAAALADSRRIPEGRRRTKRVRKLAIHLTGISDARLAVLLVPTPPRTKATCPGDCNCRALSQSLVKSPIALVLWSSSARGHSGHCRGTPAMRVVKTAQHGTPLLVNGGFEELQQGKPAPWFAWQQGFASRRAKDAAAPRASSASARKAAASSAPARRSRSTAPISRPSSSGAGARPRTSAAAPTTATRSTWTSSMRTALPSGAKPPTSPAARTIGKSASSCCCRTSRCKSLTLHCLFRGHTGKVWFDDVSLEEVPTPAGAVLFQGVPLQGVTHAQPEHESRSTQALHARRPEADAARQHHHVAAARRKGVEQLRPLPASWRGISRRIQTSMRSPAAPAQELGLKLEAELHRRPGTILPSKAA